jgi:hypothetical protein
MVGSPEQKGVRRAIGYEEPLNVSRPNRAVGKTSDHYLRERWNAGGHRARARCREMHAQGLPGQSSMVADSVSRLRPVHGRLSTHRTAGSPATSAAVAKPLPPRRAPWLVRRREAKRTDAAQDQRARRQAPEGEIAAAIGWTQDFADLVRQRQPAHLETWLERATARCLQAFKSLAKG